MILVLLLSIPLIASGLISLCRRRETMELIHGVSSVTSLILAVVIGADIRMNHGVVQWSSFRADALSALMIAIVTFVGAVAGIYAIGYMRQESGNEHFLASGPPFIDGYALSGLHSQPLMPDSLQYAASRPPDHRPVPPRHRRLRLFYALFQLFVFTMLLAVTTDNLGVMWVAIEGTTLSTVFLVNLHDNHTSLEAAYKYLIISSIGIALAFMGTVLVYHAAATQVGEIGLNWTSLVEIAGRLDPRIVKLAFIFILVGYGTKAGLAPMHTWLPDAHSEAPAPISALMSGVLLNVGLYALMRFKAVTDITAGPAFSSAWLMRFGLLSLGLAAAFLVSQRNYKRMLAYSSVEHTGIIALGLGFGGYWGMLGALLHMVNHALSKSMLFILSGSILLKYRTTEIRGVRGLMKAAPWTGFIFLCGILALVGLPPFGLFISEFIIFRAGFAAHMAAYAVVGLVLLALVFAGMIRSVNEMLYGNPAEPLTSGDPLRWPITPLAVNLVLLIGLGLTLPEGVRDFLNQILKVLGVSL